jgi:hypothetical protein
VAPYDEVRFVAESNFGSIVFRFSRFSCIYLRAEIRGLTQNLLKITADIR